MCLPPFWNCLVHFNSFCKLRLRGLYFLTLKRKTINLELILSTFSVPLKFNIRPRNTYVNIGNDVTLECNVYGIPGPTIEWYHDGEAIEPGDIFEVSPTGSLTIKQAITEDSGIYQCVADNTVENLQALAQLIVVAEGILFLVIFLSIFCIQNCFLSKIF